MDCRSLCGLALIARRGQPSSTTIAGNNDPYLCMQGLVKSRSCRGVVGKWRRPRPVKPPHGTQGRRMLGPAVLCPCPFASRRDQVHARLGPGGYCRRSGNGGPQTCLPAAWLEWGPSTAHLHQRKTQDPREGPSLARRTTRCFLRRDLLRMAHEEAEGSRQGTSRGAHDTSHDDQGCQAGASPRSVPLSSLEQRGKRRRGDQAKAPISVQQDQDQSNGGKEVTMEPRTASPQGLWQAKTNFSQDKCTRYSPSNWPIVGALPAQIFGKRPRAFAYK